MTELTKEDFIMHGGSWFNIERSFTLEEKSKILKALRLLDLVEKEKNEQRNVSKSELLCRLLEESEKHG